MGKYKFFFFWKVVQSYYPLDGIELFSVDVFGMLIVVSITTFSLTEGGQIFGPYLQVRVVSKLYHDLCVVLFCSFSLFFLWLIFPSYLDRNGLLPYEKIYLFGLLRWFVYLLFLGDVDYPLELSNVLSSNCTFSVYIKIYNCLSYTFGFTFCDMVNINKVSCHV